jgi:hypothetical protein
MWCMGFTTVHFTTDQSSLKPCCLRWLYAPAVVECVAADTLPLSVCIPCSLQPLLALLLLHQHSVWCPSEPAQHRHRAKTKTATLTTAATHQLRHHVLLYC